MREKRNDSSRFGLMLKNNSICFNRVLGALSPEYLVNFLLNKNTPPCLGNIFRFMVFKLLENAFLSQAKYLLCTMESFDDQYL